MAPPAQLPRVRSAEASIEKGRAAYADQRFRVALEHFTLVAGNCPCANPSSSSTSRGSGSSAAETQQRRRRERCTCRDFGRAVARHSRQRGAVYAEATKECKCGAEKTWGKCHREAHVQALDYRAACFEKMGNLEKARKDAEWLLEIAPRRLEGYMRLGKIYRMDKKPDLAWAAWSAGVDVGQNEGLTGTPKYEQLLKIREPLHKHFCRKDPLDLPQELVESIFSYFDFIELCRMSGVSKRWDNFFDTHPYIWREVRFQSISSQKLPRMSFIKTLRRRTAGRARTLVIQDAHAFQLNESKWISLIQTTNPQTTSYLEVGGIRREMNGDWGYKLPPKPPFFEGLTDLKLGFTRGPNPDHTGRGGPQAFVRQFIERAKENLHSVTLTNPFALARATPNLQQLSLANFGVFTGVDTLLPPEDCWSLWRHLQVISLGPTRSPLSVGNKRHFPPLHPSSFRIFEARAGRQGNQGDWLPQQLPLDYSGYDQASYSSASAAENQNLDLVTYPNLERFWMPKLPLSVDLATILLEPAIRSGRLREVGLCWRQDPGQYFPGALDFLRGAASVRTLGFFEFDLESHEALTRDPAHRGVDPTALLFGFLESFPNLEVLELHSSSCDPRRIGVVIERMVGLGRLKKVYQKALTGVHMDQLRAFCETHGVELEYGSWTSSFPVQLEPLEPVDATS
ncbi:f-box domain-containing protein [Colletotrichum karsti]|uniref:F-box domain-containing protein n=1 Tax=Colletotrichum karsti TaxID=1095194 RepID=A0A9P6IHF3_9PEZI|nr:f-box domain-containing protein [Colletotrichum karsti]KAF9882326.1 f-box domain-containing protein [Colletotrichum karsti]